ncbi:MAG: TonB-dependent receptor [Candidatus Angelobacter sp.]|nr:TonB-dependent receptor [Candidatus Angelobacter sp.]
MTLHFQLPLASVNEKVEVSAAIPAIDPQSSTTSTTLSREQIATTPGADSTNSLNMITNYVPSAVVVHDQLHIRGGHQVSWLLDGVPVPNTNIASNVGPQFDPKDIDYIEIQRGGYSAQYGDRTYGVFNVVTRSGFERNREAEAVINYGSFNTTNDQLSFGDHTQRFAYYASVNGNRTDLGLETPTADVIHAANSGGGGFLSLIFNKTPNDQLRFVGSGRNDHYQVPNTPDDQLAGIRDVDNERDALVNFSWVHTASKGAVFTLSPFYHFNRAAYDGGATDFPVIPEQDRGSNYFGVVGNLALVSARHNARVGLQTFGEHENELFALTATDGSGLNLRQRQITTGHTEVFYAEDQFKVTTWLTLNGGVRLTHFSGLIQENSADPRVGAAIDIPRIHWVLRGFYGRYYQAPPLVTLSGPLLDLALAQGVDFLPLRGERDEQYEFGVAIPVLKTGWSLDLSHFHTNARNYFDHDALGNSNIFFPLTLERARIRGWEASLRSPRLFKRAQIHLAYSRQYAQAKGAVSGGLTDFSPPADEFFFLDHDQRDTLSTGLTIDLPGRAWASSNVSYGSGFLDGNGPDHLPPHTTFDISMGKSFGERWSAQVTGLNLADNRYLLDNSNTFGGTHFYDPRRVSVQVRYRFRY